ncbi:MAG: FAD-dependent oxidoreductase [Nostoc sp.]|uniref:FAD-dependent oxidoreductase n=1 Tax=Nostoc sp. TaxID=1180 RepID=UPI002FFCBC17
MPTKLPQAWLSSDACGGLRLRMMTNFEFPAMTPSPNPSLVNCDVVIVGGGISGLTLACGLQSSGLQILVVEAQQEQQATERSRAYALSPLTSKIFRDLGLWEQIAPKISHFSRVLLSDADYPHRVEFCPKDLGEAAVYYCAEHEVLMAALQQRVTSSQHYRRCLLNSGSRL